MMTPYDNDIVQVPLGLGPGLDHKVVQHQLLQPNKNNKIVYQNHADQNKKQNITSKYVRVAAVAQRRAFRRAAKFDIPFSVFLHLKISILAQKSIFS